MFQWLTKKGCYIKVCLSFSFLSIFWCVLDFTVNKSLYAFLSLGKPKITNRKVVENYGTLDLKALQLLLLVYNDIA